MSSTQYRSRRSKSSTQVFTLCETLGSSTIQSGNGTTEQTEGSRSTEYYESDSEREWEVWNDVGRRSRGGENLDGTLQASRSRTYTFLVKLSRLGQSDRLCYQIGQPRRFDSQTELRSQLDSTFDSLDFNVCRGVPSRFQLCVCDGWSGGPFVTD